MNPDDVKLWPTGSMHCPRLHDAALVPLSNPYKRSICRLETHLSGSFQVDIVSARQKDGNVKTGPCPGHAESYVATCHISLSIKETLDAPCRSGTNTVNEPPQRATRSRRCHYDPAGVPIKDIYG